MNRVFFVCEMHFTEDEITWCVKKYNDGVSYLEVVRQFCTVFPNRKKPSRTTIHKYLKRFITTGSVNYKYERKSRTGPNRIETASDTPILAAVEVNPASSSRHIGDLIGKSHSQVIGTLHKHRYRSYKTSIHQELRPGDAERAALEVRDDDPNFIQNIIFTDKSSFRLHHRPVVQNYRMWSKQNPHVYLGTLNVWSGIMGQHVSNPLVIDGRLTGLKYLVS